MTGRKRKPAAWRTGPGVESFPTCVCGCSSLAHGPCRCRPTCIRHLGRCHDCDCSRFVEQYALLGAS